MEAQARNAIPEKEQGEPRQLIEVLLDVQERDGYISEPALRQISENLAVPLAEAWSVANFYNVLSLEPRGKHLITVCTGTACYVRGGGRLLDGLQADLKIRPGETTTDGVVSLESVSCFGACALAPVVVLDKKVLRQQSSKSMKEVLEGISSGPSDGGPSVEPSSPAAQGAGS